MKWPFTERRARKRATEAKETAEWQAWAQRLRDMDTRIVYRDEKGRFRRKGADDE